MARHSEGVVYISPLQLHGAAEPIYRKDKISPEFIRNIIIDMINTETSNDCQEDVEPTDVESNYQCGECGDAFKTLEQTEAHIDVNHSVNNVNDGGTNDTDKDEEIRMLKEKNEYIVKKNLALDKDVRRLNLAFKFH